MHAHRITRRAFLRHAGTVAMSGLLLGAAGRDERGERARRRRRIIFNDDGDDVWDPNAATPEGFVGVRLKHMLDTQAGTLFYCTTQSFNYFSHNTKVGQVFLSRDGAFAHNNMPALIDQGTDPLKLAVAFAHRHDVEAIWTLRMNDIHDAFTPALWPQWKQDHPDALLGKPEDWGQHPAGGQRRWWAGVNFYREDVRKRTIELIEEVARNYDVDGIDLDWLRHPIHFPETMEGRPVKAEGVALITALVRDVRRMLERVGEERGRPILLATRVALTVKHGRYMGTDIETWLDEGLIDFITVGGGYVPFSMPTDEIVALARPHGVPVYPCISASGMMRRAPYGRGDLYGIEAWRATAANAFRNGADGVSLFNLFPRPGADAHNAFCRQVFNECGEPATLAGKDKLFCLDNAGHLDGCGYINHVVPYEGCLPKPLDAEKPTRVTVPIGDDPAAAASAEVRVQVDVDVPVELRINGEAVALDKSPELCEAIGMHWSTGPLDRTRLVQGNNQVEVRPAGALNEAAGLTGVEMRLSYA